MLNDVWNPCDPQIAEEDQEAEGCQKWLHKIKRTRIFRDKDIQNRQKDQSKNIVHNRACNNELPDRSVQYLPRRKDGCSNSKRAWSKARTDRQGRCKIRTARPRNESKAQPSQQSQKRPTECHKDCSSSSFS
mmetsp:Transcript_65026/g.187135  ORF Transcript_65026/g.187135 Transcript_65026/m.187135 type:complete len:132 (+) Transcript_65026:66-461(+)